MRENIAALLVVSLFPVVTTVWLGNVIIGLVTSLALSAVYLNRDDPVVAGVAVLGGGVMVASSFTAPVNVTFAAVTSTMVLLSGLSYARRVGPAPVPLIAVAGIGLGVVLVVFPTLVGSAVVALAAIGLFASVNYRIDRADPGRA
ncbi:MAG: hypothetical protein ABEI98_10400 [Halorhabdus sp.]